MFTGIIREIGQVAGVRRRGGVVELLIRAPDTAAVVGPLESVSINGACLTVVRARQGVLTFEVIPETQRLTTIGGLRIGSRVNVEPSLSLTDRLNGHLVLGHVDGIGRVVHRQQHAGHMTLEIQMPAGLRRWLVTKGPITVDGVSLTAGRRRGGSRFEAYLIPETLRQTTLADRRPGDGVNLECDYIAKLIGQYLHRRQEFEAFN